MATTFDYGTLPADYQPSFEETTGLIKKVAIQSIDHAKASNPLAFLDKGSIDTGEIVEKSKIMLKEAHDWTDEEDDEFWATHSDFKTVYFSNYDQKQFGVSVSTERIRGIIANKGVGTAEVIDEIVGGLSQSEFNYDFSSMKTLLKNSEQYLTKAADVDNGSDLVLQIRNAITKIKFYNDSYFGSNITGVSDETPESRIRIVMPEYVRNKLDVITLSAIYNLEKMNLVAEIHTTDSEDGHVYVFDEEAYGVHTRLREMTDKRHTTNLKYYYYLTISKMRYYCPLFKATYIDASQFVNPTTADTTETTETTETTGE